MKVLCLDIEGGYGGSSRSLFESVRHLPKDLAVEVWCRRKGPVQDRYASLGVACRVMPDMPHVSSLPRISRSLYAYSRFAAAWPKSRGFREDLAAAARSRVDLVHLNHEGLFLLGGWLRGRLGSAVKLTAHVRTLLPSTPFSRWQYRTLSRATDRLVFITEMERNNVSRLTRKPATGPVIYNIVPDDQATPDPDLASDVRFKVVSLSNYAWGRGNDRLVDLAATLAGRGRRDDFLFVVAGDIALSGSLPGELGEIARRSGSLADYADRRGVASMFRFLGHVAEPAPILAACDVLARPSRNNDPWGREVLEAMQAGLPVLATGTYDRFVESGVTGVLHSVFNAEAMASALVEFADDRDAMTRMSRNARARVASLCSASERAADLAALWRSVVQADCAPATA